MRIKLGKMCKNGLFQKDPFLTYRVNFRRPGRGAGESSKEYLKFV